MHLFLLWSQLTHVGQTRLTRCGPVLLFVVKKCWINERNIITATKYIYKYIIINNVWFSRLLTLGGITNKKWNNQ